MRRWAVIICLSSLVFIPIPALAQMGQYFNSVPPGYRVVQPFSATPVGTCLYDRLSIGYWCAVPLQGGAQPSRCNSGYHEDAGYCVEDGYKICPNSNGKSCRNDKECWWNPPDVEVTVRSLYAAGYNIAPVEIRPGLNCLDPGFADVLNAFVESEGMREYSESQTKAEEQAKEAFGREYAQLQARDSEVDADLDEITAFEVIDEHLDGESITAQEFEALRAQANSTRCVGPYDDACATLRSPVIAEPPPETNDSPLDAVANRETRVLPRPVVLEPSAAEPAYQAEEVAERQAEEARRALEAYQAEVKRQVEQELLALHARRAELANMSIEERRVDARAQAIRLTEIERQVAIDMGLDATTVDWGERARQIEAEIWPEAAYSPEITPSASVFESSSGLTQAEFEYYSSGQAQIYSPNRLQEWPSSPLNSWETGSSGLREEEGVPRRTFSEWVGDTGIGLRDRISAWIDKEPSPPYAIQAPRIALIDPRDSATEEVGKIDCPWYLLGMCKGAERVINMAPQIGR